jgi:hypothetical protein
MRKPWCIRLISSEGENQQLPERVPGFRLLLPGLGIEEILAWLQLERMNRPLRP